jgi:putative ABC transport system permease protein
MTIPFRPQLDASVLAASFAAMVLAVIVFGVWPALQSTRSDVRSALGAGLSATPAKWRLHRNIIAWQVCGSVALLLVALLTAKVIANAGGLTATTRHANLALAQIEFTLNGKTETQARQAVAAILDDVRSQFGVQSASASNGLPFGFGPPGDATWVTTPDRAAQPRTDGAWALTPTIATAPTFFSTVAIRIVRGRPFTDQDDAGAPKVAIVSEEFAREMLRSIDVIGRSVVVDQSPIMPGRHVAGSAPVAIVGVAADDEPWLTSRKRKSLLFVPLAQRYQPYAPMMIVVRARDAAAGVAALESSIRRVDPSLSISAAGTGAVLLDGPLFLLRVIAAMAGGLGAIALALAMLGLFGVLSHVVTKRTREIGIRLAIGAARADIFGLVVRDGLRPVAKGLVLGLGIGVAARVMVKTFVATDISAVDPWPLLLLPIPFIAAAVAACYLPAARASRVDPNVALRDL